MLVDNHFPEITAENAEQASKVVINAKELKSLSRKRKAEEKSNHEPQDKGVIIVE